MKFMRNLDGYNKWYDLIYPQLTRQDYYDEGLDKEHEFILRELFEID